MLLLPSKKMKFDVHWPLSDTVCTPGWTVALDAGAHVGAAAAGAAVTSAAAIVAATMSWGFFMNAPNARAPGNLRSASILPRMPVPLFDTRTPLAPLRAEIDARIREVVDRGTFILGPEVRAFEQEFADYIGTGHAVGVANGTDALVLALRALGVG